MCRASVSRQPPIPSRAADGRRRVAHRALRKLRVVFLVVALVLVFLLPWPASLAGLLTGLVLFVGELGFWHRRVRGKPKAVGPQRLIGMEGVVLSTCRPEGQARVDGAIWTARCNEGADVGERVRVTAIDGLILTVARTGGGTIGGA